MESLTLSAHAVLLRAVPPLKVVFALWVGISHWSQYHWRQHGKMSSSLATWKFDVIVANGLLWEGRPETGSHLVSGHHPSKLQKVVGSFKTCVLMLIWLNKYRRRPVPQVKLLERSLGTENNSDYKLLWSPLLFPFFPLLGCQNVEAIDRTLVQRDPWTASKI